MKSLHFSFFLLPFWFVVGPSFGQLPDPPEQPAVVDETVDAEVADAITEAADEEAVDAEVEQQDPKPAADEQLESVEDDAASDGELNPSKDDVISDSETQESDPTAVSSDPKASDSQNDQFENAAATKSAEQERAAQTDRSKVATPEVAPAAQEEAAPAAQEEAAPAAQEPGALGVYLNDSPQGVSVRGIYANSPASVAGLRVGDRIDSINNQRFNNVSELIRAIQQARSGSEMTVHVWRNGRLYELKPTLASYSEVFGRTLDARNEVQNRQSHFAFRVPVEPNGQRSLNANQSSIVPSELQERVKNLEAEVAQLREELKKLQQSKSIDAVEPADSIDPPVTGVQPVVPDVGLTDGAIIKGKPESFDPE